MRCVVTCLLMLMPGLDDIRSTTGLGGVAVSPDGSAVAYVVSPVGADGRRRSLIRVVSAAGGEDRELARGSSPAWSADGQRMAYLGSGRQIWVVGSSGGAPERVTDHPGHIDRFQWAPDGRSIAFLARDREHADLRFFVRRREPGVPTVVDVNNLPRNRLWVVNVATKQSRAITPDTYSVGGYEQWFPDGFSWSPDSRSIAFSRRPHAKAGSHLYGDIAVVDAGGGKTRMLTTREGMEGYPRWSPDGKQIAFIATDRYDWVTVSYLYLVDVETGEQRKITPTFDEKIKWFFWAAGGDRILFIAGEGVGTQIYSVDVAARRVDALTKGIELHSGLSVSGDGRSIAYIRQNASNPPDVYFTRLDPFRPKRLTTVNPQIASWAKIETEVVRWKSFDGMTIEGLVHKPAGYQDARRYPLLVVPHGGPHGVMTNGFVTGEYRLFAQRGWVVFRPNFRGSGHYGERFLRANLGGWGLGDYQDVMSGVDHLIESGLVDPDRMAISGASYGGYMTSWTISQTNRFKAAVIGAAITDVPSFIRTTDVPERFEDYLGKDTKRYYRSSPMYFAENIQTPSLVWHGDEDIRVPLMQGRHLYTALLKNKVPAE
ncbi:MAG: S9 family peptidase, partial [bacterium]|nr:S9 family peptidase [bacterium]